MFRVSGSGFRVGAAVLVGLLLFGCGEDSDGKKKVDLTVFHAAGLAPVLEAVKSDCEKELGIRLRTEASGSQVACHKLAGMKRQCDLVMLADATLVEQLLGGVCSWRLDFANDEVVLAVGKRAPRIADAEIAWPKVVLDPKVRVGRVDENQGPIGYRALMVWKLQAGQGNPGLHDALKKKCVKVVDHVSRLTPLLKTGEIDYAFAYRSICIAHDIRYIKLDERVNLGSLDVDYSAAKIDFRKRGSNRSVTASGAPITWTLSIPDRGADSENATRFARWLLAQRAALLKKNGFRPISKPRFFGSPERHKPFADISVAVARKKGSAE